MPDRTDPRHEMARLLVTQHDISLREISRRIDVPRGTLSGWVHRYGWLRPNTEHGAPVQLPAGVSGEPPVDTAAGTTQRPEKRGTRRNALRHKRRPHVKTLVNRLYRIITHNLELMEIRMSDDSTSAADNPERDIRAIGNIVRSVEKLREIEPDQSKRDTATTGNHRSIISAEEEDRIRRTIIEHILKLRERKRREGGDR